jgi:hypothetical protein
MNGVDPLAFMQDLAGRIDRMTERRDIERALDDLEYLMEVLDPELQDPAYALVERLRAKLERAGG